VAYTLRCAKITDVPFIKESIASNPEMIARDVDNFFRDYLMLEEASPLGFVALFPLNHSTEELGSLYVVPARRRNGTSGVLIDGAIKYANPETTQLALITSTPKVFQPHGFVITYNDLPEELVKRLEDYRAVGGPSKIGMARYQNYLLRHQ